MTSKATRPITGSGSSAMKKDAIAKACGDVETGQLLDQFIVDVIQGGAGTSTDMDANEAIANRALGTPWTGQRRLFIHSSQRGCEPGKSANDVYPTVLKIATINGAGELLAAMAHLRAAFTRSTSAPQPGKVNPVIPEVSLTRWPSN